MDIKTNITDPELLDMLKYFCALLRLERYDHKLSISLIQSSDVLFWPDKNALGFCRPEADGSISIFLDNSKLTSVGNIAIALAHELIHAQQIGSGRLRLGKDRIYWDNKNATGLVKTTYRRLFKKLEPWEKQAYGHMHEMVNSYFRSRAGRIYQEKS
jgi:hypothetical protein